MANVREVFPGLEKKRRVKRGQAPKLVWNKSPSLDQVIPKLATALVDSLIRTVNSHGTQVEMQRYVFRSGAKFGYLCFKTSDVLLDRCKSYAEFQKVFDTLENSVKWAPSFEKLVAYVAGHCTSPSYVIRVRQLRV